MAAKKSLKKVASKLKAKASSAKAKVQARAKTAKASAKKVAAKAQTRAKAVATGAPKPLSYAPAGVRSVTPSLVASDASAAIEFYKRAFDAKEITRSAAPDGKSIWHAQIQIGDSAIFINDPMGGPPAPSLDRPSPTSLMIYVPDVDRVFKQAIAAGGKSTMPVADQFWGDRMGGIMDPFGNAWMVATKTKDLTEEQVRKGGEEFARQMEAMSAGAGMGSQPSGGGAMA